MNRWIRSSWSLWRTGHHWSTDCWVGWRWSWSWWIGRRRCSRSRCQPERICSRSVSGRRAAWSIDDARVSQCTISWGCRSQQESPRWMSSGRSCPAEMLHSVAIIARQLVHLTHVLHDLLELDLVSRVFITETPYLRTILDVSGHCIHFHIWIIDPCRQHALPSNCK